MANTNSDYLYVLYNYSIHYIYSKSNNTLNIKCAFYIVRFTVYYISDIIKCELYNIHCKICIVYVDCTMYIVKYALYM